MGKIIPQTQARVRRLQKAAFINRLEELKKATDWAETPLFYMWERYGRWMHMDKSIYSDSECKHHNSIFKETIDKKMNRADFKEEEKKFVK